MVGIVQRVSDVAARALLRPAAVTSLTALGDFRMIELAGERLAGVEWTPGDKIRVRADGLALRTYTPISWDPDLGTTRFLAYAHGEGPGAMWCTSVQAGVDCQLLGPDHSVRLDRIEAAPVFVGDETSFGLLLALLGERPHCAPRSTLFEVSDPDVARAVLSDHGADPTELFARTRDDAHLTALGQAVLDALRTHHDAPCA